MNENKHWAPVFDADRRPVKTSSLDALENVGVQFNAYGIQPGDSIHVAKDPEVVEQAPRREGQRPTYLVACTRNGVKNWLNPAALLALNADLQPIYPKWAALGGAKAVVEKLIEMGEIKTPKEPIMVTMTKFNRDGTIAEEAVRDEKGELILNEDGTPKMVNARVERPRANVPDPKA